MAMYGAIHILYIKRKEEGRGQISVERCVKEEETVWDFMLPILEKISSGKLLQLRQSILKIQ